MLTHGYGSARRNTSRATAGVPAGASRHRPAVPVPVPRPCSLSWIAQHLRAEASARSRCRPLTRGSTTVSNACAAMPPVADSLVATIHPTVLRLKTSPVDALGQLAALHQLPEGHQAADS